MPSHRNPHTQQSPNQRTQQHPHQQMNPATSTTAHAVWKPHCQHRHQQSPAPPNRKSRPPPNTLSQPRPTPTATQKQKNHPNPPDHADHNLTPAPGKGKGHKDHHCQHHNYRATHRHKRPTKRIQSPPANAPGISSPSPPCQTLHHRPHPMPHATGIPHGARTAKHWGTTRKLQGTAPHPLTARPEQLPTPCGPRILYRPRNQHRPRPYPGTVCPPPHGEPNIRPSTTTPRPPPPRPHAPQQEVTLRHTSLTTPWGAYP